LYRGYKLLEQAESEGVFDRQDRVKSQFYFSHLYTAADQREFQDFLAIDPNTPLRPNPVPRSKLPELGEFMSWLYGRKSTGKPPIVRTQNPDLNILREVISKPESLSALRSGYPLDRAYTLAIGDRRRFRDALVAAKMELQSAKATVTTGYGGEEELYRTMDDITQLATSISDEMRKKRGQQPSGTSY
jgi:hypothetical protein